MKFLFIHLIFLLNLVQISAQTDTKSDYNCEGLDTIKTWQGVSYCLIKSNPIGQSPVKGDYLYVAYKGYLENGVVFDSSKTGEYLGFRLLKFEVIKAWDIVFERLKEGERARIFVPYQFAYGKQGKPPVIPRKANLIFDVELIRVVK